MNTIDIYKECIYDKLNLPKKTNKDFFLTVLKNFLSSDKEENPFINQLIDLLPTDDWYKCNLKSFELLGEGQNGAIFKLNDTKVIKFPFVRVRERKNKIVSSKPGCVSRSERDKKIISDYLEEQITNVLMYCYEEKIKERFKNYVQCFPKIFSIQKLVVKNTNKFNIGTITEELVSLYTIDDIEEIIDIVIQVANNLYILQKTCNFMHRDLHAGNVMLKHNTNDDKDIILYDGRVLKNQRFHVVFIDFANSCAKLEGLTVCSDSLNMYSNCQEDGIYNFKEDYDLRLFLSSLYTLDIEGLDDFLDNFFDIKKIIEIKKTEDIIFYAYYEDQIGDIDDKKFYPENVILKIKKSI